MHKGIFVFLQGKNLSIAESGGKSDYDIGIFTPGDYRIIAGKARKNPCHLSGNIQGI